MESQQMFKTVILLHFLIISASCARIPIKRDVSSQPDTPPTGDGLLEHLDDSVMDALSSLLDGPASPEDKSSEELRKSSSEERKKTSSSKDKLTVAKIDNQTLNSFNIKDNSPDSVLPRIPIFPGSMFLSPSMASRLTTNMQKRKKMNNNNRNLFAGMGRNMGGMLPPQSGFPFMQRPVPPVLQMGAGRLMAQDLLHRPGMESFLPIIGNTLARPGSPFGFTGGSTGFGGSGFDGSGIPNSSSFSSLSNPLLSSPFRSDSGMSGLTGGFGGLGGGTSSSSGFGSSTSGLRSGFGGGSSLGLGGLGGMSGLSSGFGGMSGLSSGFGGMSGLSSGFGGMSGLSSGFGGMSGLSSGFGGMSGLSSGFGGMSGLSGGLGGLGGGLGSLGGGMSGLGGFGGGLGGLGGGLGGLGGGLGGLNSGIGGMSLLGGGMGLRGMSGLGLQNPRLTASDFNSDSNSGNGFGMGSINQDDFNLAQRPLDLAKNSSFLAFGSGINPLLGTNKFGLTGLGGMGGMPMVNPLLLQQAGLLGLNQQMNPLLTQAQANPLLLQSLMAGGGGIGGSSLTPMIQPGGLLSLQPQNNFLGFSNGNSFDNLFRPNRTFDVLSGGVFSGSNQDLTKLEAQPVTTSSELPDKARIIIEPMSQLSSPAVITEGSTTTLSSE